MILKKIYLVTLTLWTLLFSVVHLSAQNNVKGTWNAPIALNIDGVHGVVLPNGKVLFIPHRTDISTTTCVVFDPNNPAGANYITVPENFFCGGHSMLNDGKVLFVGGEDNAIQKSAYFDYTTENWTMQGNLNKARWYPSAIQLGDGSVWAFGGQNEPAEVASNDPTIERYDPATGNWTLVGGQDLPGQWEEAYNRLHLLPDGRIFQSGHLPETYTYDPVAKTWTFVATTNLGKARGNGSSVMLQDGRIFIVGGDDEIDYFKSAEIIDLSQPSPSWQSVPDMQSLRSFTDAVLLPDGNVFVMGGDEATGSRSTVPILYNPNTNSWTDMASFSLERGYHSTALLLPDARVMISGGEGHEGPHATGEFGESSQFEIWNPYYLHKSARPVINTLPSAAAYGQQLTLNYNSDNPVTHVVIHRSGSQTHAFSYNQISVPVNFDSNNSGTATFTIPNNPNQLPPSFYMVFLMNNEGVPSVARWVQIGGTVSLANELILFDVQNQEETIALKWSTASESNNKGFWIEKSTDSKSWTTLDFIEGVGESNMYQNYEYLDNNPVVGPNYYRLKQVDFDENFKHSHIKLSLWRKGLNDAEVMVFPNPAEDWISVFCPEGHESHHKARFEVFDKNGRLVASEIKITNNNGVHLNISALNKGAYVLKISTAHEVHTTRFLKAK